MENQDDEDDLKLIKASARLLSDLEDALPKLLWRGSKGPQGERQVHSRVKWRDLNHVLNLIEPFQGEPQLLDAKLKVVIPPIVDAYLQSLLKPKGTKLSSADYLDSQSTVCILLYTLCKVRGQKVIVGFLNNEPRYLEPILVALENATNLSADDSKVKWQVPYVLLLWLSHLLLAPFDLASISSTPAGPINESQVLIAPDLPPLPTRVLRLGVHYIPSSTKAQEAAASMLVRLVTRPDMQSLQLADSLVTWALKLLHDWPDDASRTIYDNLGPLRFLSGVTASAELGHLVPEIYRTCDRLSIDDSSFVSSSAVAKKTIVKMMRNIAVLSLRSTPTQAAMASLLEDTNVLEEVIDYLLRSLSDRDTPVRYAAAKAISVIILELDPSLGHEIIQAVLEMFKEDMPRHGQGLDFRTANPLKWHGLTLALAYTLFKRSASSEQLPDIVDALTSALQFEQRTATGSSLGTNVRDAANFGIWSLSRRYTTVELLSVKVSELKTNAATKDIGTVIRFVAIHLMLSACLDPAGNIRRGSSAALQELIGRHPNQVHEGITLVQIIDYQAVGLRKRAMVTVARETCELHETYWRSFLGALLGWRGLGSADVLSRDAAASSLKELSILPCNADDIVLRAVLDAVERVPITNVEDLHGLILSLALLLEIRPSGKFSKELLARCWRTLTILERATRHFSPRVLRSELPSAMAALITWLCADKYEPPNQEGVPIDLDLIETLVERLLQRSEDSVVEAVPPLMWGLIRLAQRRHTSFDILIERNLMSKVESCFSKTTVQDAGRVFALGALTKMYADQRAMDQTVLPISTLIRLMTATNVDWRVIGAKVLQLVIEWIAVVGMVDTPLTSLLVEAIHRGLTDYTIDERGDIGSLVRLQARSCALSMFDHATCFDTDGQLQVLQADIYRLSLEKLDRVRLAAAQCRYTHLDAQPSKNTGGLTDIGSVSSTSYLSRALEPLSDIVNQPKWKLTALLEGCISCAGLSAEPLLQASRAALTQRLSALDNDDLVYLMNLFIEIFQSQLPSPSHPNANPYPTLELLGFLLDMRIPQRLITTSSSPSSSPVEKPPEQTVDQTDQANAKKKKNPGKSTIKWRLLLSTVQKSHHKSNDLPRLLAALHVYYGLVEIPEIRHDVLRKIFSMLKSNPYPRVRLAAAEGLYMSLTTTSSTTSTAGEEALLERNWIAAKSSPSSSSSSSSSSSLTGPTTTTNMTERMKCQAVLEQVAGKLGLGVR